MFNDRQEEQEQLEERLVNIARVAKVVKGGRHFGFRAVVVVGDRNGSVGIGIGKAREVPDAIRKGSERARNSMKKICLDGTTIPHQVISKFGAAQVMLKPASPGTGVIAGSAVRAVLEAVGICDILTKSLGSANQLNVVQATMQGLLELKDTNEEAGRRGKQAVELAPFWRRKNVAS